MGEVAPVYPTLPATEGTTATMTTTTTTPTETATQDQGAAAAAASAPPATAVHPDPRIQVALQAKMSMGFSNEGAGWPTCSRPRRATLARCSTSSSLSRSRSPNDPGIPLGCFDGLCCWNPIPIFGHQ